MALALDGSGLRGETPGDPVHLYPDRDAGPGGDAGAGGGAGEPPVFRDGDDYRATVPAALRFALGRGPDDVVCHADLGGQRATLRKQHGPPPTATALAALVGRYDGAETGTRHEIRLAGGGLVIEYGPGQARRLVFPMEPVAPDVFLVRPAAPGIAYRHLFRFERDAAGAVTGAVVTLERLKNVRLARVAPPPAAATGDAAT
jgi:hypothetical protein